MPTETPTVKTKTHRRFRDAAEIERQMDKVKSDALFADTEADAANARAYAMMRGEIKEGELGESDHPKQLLDLRDSKRAKSKRLMGATMARLKERLVVMRTQASLILVEDESIPRSK